MKRWAVIITMFLTVMSVWSCVDSRSGLNVIPYPNNVRMGHGSFTALGAKVICDEGMCEDSKAIVADFCDMITPASGDCGEGTIRFNMDRQMLSEAYRIKVAGNEVNVWASDLRGFSYAVQTMRQMLPDMPCCTIDDSPRFAYRGLHLDVARHFFDVSVVKRYLDIMQFHKMNTLHLHLTDDQGWRIEIKKYPRLTEVGSVRKETLIGHHHTSNKYDGIPHGGYYTQEEIHEIVSYAASKGITIIPEIDLPGHMLAALTAYPELGCTDGPYELWCKWGISDDVLCPGKDETFTFIEGVLDEIIELFPSKYIHIGGDECPKVRWEKCPLCQTRISELGIEPDSEHTAEHYLQSYVIARVEKYLNGKGRKIIGWDEILEGGLAPNATVMSWRGEAGGKAAAAQGHEVIMTPNTYFYLDYCQGIDMEHEPLSIGGYLPVRHCYSYEPYSDDMTEEECDRILGVQANLWTEYIKTEEHLQYMLLPRAAALSEVQWCQPETKDFQRFLDGLNELCRIYDSMGWAYAKHVFQVECEVVNKGEGAVDIILSTQGNAPIHYTLDGSEPTKDSPLYDTPLSVSEDCILYANAFREEMETRPVVKKFSGHLALGRPVSLGTEPYERYYYGTPGTLTDGVRGRNNHSCSEWTGWRGTPMEVTVDMGGSASYSTVVLSTCINKPSYLFNPLSIKISVSDNGEDFTDIAYEEFSCEDSSMPDGIKEYKMMFNPESSRYLRINAQTARELPEWHPKHGRREGLLFVDEIMVL